MTWGDLRVDPVGEVPVASRSPLYKGHRCPAGVVSCCVWLYHRFPLSFREVGELMLESDPATT
jgi:putative transposase